MRGLPQSARFSLMLWRRRRLPPDAVGELIDLPTTQLRVVDSGGDGRGAYVVVPDPPNVIEHCLPLLRRVSAGQRVVALELPGFGFSRPRPGFRFDIASQSAVLHQVYDRLGLTQTVLDMSCLGAYVGLDFAARHPERVRHLLVQQVPSLLDAQRWARRADLHGLIRTPWIGQCFMCAFRRQAARHWYGAALPRPHAAALRHAYTAPALAALDAGGLFLLADAYQALLAHPAGASAPRQPVTALWGGADRTHAGTPPQSLLRDVPDARWVEFEGCGHFPGLESPERYDDLLREASVKV